MSSILDQRNNWPLKIKICLPLWEFNRVCQGCPDLSTLYFNEEHLFIYDTFLIGVL